MNLRLPILFLCFFIYQNFTLKAKVTVDTISNWQIYLNNQLISSDNIRYFANRGGLLSIQQELSPTDTFHIYYHECFLFDANCNIDIISEKRKSIFIMSWKSEGWIQTSIPITSFYDKLNEVNQITIRLSYLYQREHQGKIIKSESSFDLLQIILRE